MKLRIKGNSIRYRLTKSEVDYFGKEGYLEERTEFGSQTLVYAMQKQNEASVLSAEFANDKITLLIPQQLADKWVGSNLVGLEKEMEIAPGKTLYLLLEKDFKCLDNTIEDQSDNYPNPLAEKK